MSLGIAGRIQGSARVERLVAELTLEEKVSLCHGNTNFTLPPIPRLGIPSLRMSDGPHGVREELGPDHAADPARADDFVTAFPAEIALAATWDPVLAEAYGVALGREARSRDKDMILGPGVNIARTPLCGRNFEYLGEDPLLAGKLAVAYVRGLQSGGVAACVKHFALNNQELDRMSVDVEADERALREIYLKAFAMVVRDSDVMAVMGAYNKFRGRHCCHHPYLLVDILKRDWGFRGLVVSDWGGVHDTLEAAADGLDVEMGGPDDPRAHFLGDAYLAALREGRVPVAGLDEKVRRVLGVLERLGALDGRPPAGERNTPAHRALVRRIGAEACVLLKNQGGALPLDPRRLRRVLVAGKNGATRHARGGGSSMVKTDTEITPLDGLREALGPGVRVDYFRSDLSLESGYSPLPAECLGVVDRVAGIPGWVIEYYGEPRYAGAIVLRQTLQDLDLDWYTGAPVPGRPVPGISARARARLIAPRTGAYLFRLEGIDCAELHLDGRLVAQVWEPLESAPVHRAELEAGREYELMVQLNPKVKDFRVRLRWRPFWVEEKGEEASALLAAARAADVVIFCGGLDHRRECEGGDRADLRLPDGQDGLIASLAAENPALIVVLNGGSAMDMPWLDQARAVLLSWYGGSEAGRAVADVLLGKADPGGRLPITFPRRLEDLPSHGEGEYRTGSCRYREGLRVGYRGMDAAGREPLFPFGFGLSYTRFEIADARWEPGPDGRPRVCACALANTGEVPGSTVVQAYVALVRPAASAPADAAEGRPPQELRGFAKAALNPGESRRLRLELDPDAFRGYSPSAQAWVELPGEYEVRIGFSSRDIRLRLPLRVG